MVPGLNKSKSPGTWKWEKSRENANTNTYDTFLTKISQCVQTEHVKSVFSNLLGSSNGENLKLIGWNAERSRQKKLPKDNGVKFHPTTLSSFVHTSLDYVANVELFWNCSKYTMERRKREKLIKDRTPIWWDFELSSLNDSQGPETSMYSVKGHLNPSDSIYKVQ